MAEPLKESAGRVRLYVDAGLETGARIEPDEAQAHYLLHVMRAKVGDTLLLFNGRDGEWSARVEDATKRRCILLASARLAAQADVPDVWLVFAPIKKTPADYLVQKATELGVRAICPVFTRRTIVGRVNPERMRANAIEAAEQSGRLAIPRIFEPVALEKLISTWPVERSLLFCDEAGDASSIADVLNEASAAPWAILTGPEGGFDPVERDLLRAQTFVKPVSLGKRILRADTAGLAALAVWQALRGDWKG